MSDEHTAPIVVGYDGSASATRALGRAARLAGPAGVVVVVSVSRKSGEDEGLPPPPPPADEPGVLLDAARRHLADHAQVDLREAQGDVADALASVAQEVGADLIVVGAQGSDFVARTLLGSVPQRLIQRAPCDVVVVR